MNLRCTFLGHKFRIIAPMINQCLRCGAMYETDYFESRERGYIVRYKLTDLEAKRVLARVKTV